MSIVAPRTPFEQLAARYIKHKRALGLRFDQQAWVIGLLGRFLAKAKATDLDQTQFEAWCATPQHLNATVRRMHQFIVRNLCLYRRRTEADCFVPDPLRFARRCPARAPVIFGPAEVARMLRTITELSPSRQFPLRLAVLRLAVVLLYTAGLRRGELARLTLADVDLHAGTLTELMWSSGPQIRTGYPGHLPQRHISRDFTLVEHHHHEHLPLAVADP